MTQVGDLQYLNALYGASEDPWHLRSGWYSERKSDIVLAALPRARYASTLEVGCAGGTLSAGIARRSDSVLAVDSRRDVVTEARSRTAHLSNVDVRQLRLPDEWPGQRFDLIVLNEVGYFYTAAAWAQTCHAVVAALADDGAVLACHWRHDLAGRTLETETLHGLLDSMLGLTKQTHITDADFIVDVWTTSHRSVAALEGLV